MKLSSSTEFCLFRFWSFGSKFYVFWSNIYILLKVKIFFRISYNLEFYLEELFSEPRLNELFKPAYFKEINRNRDLSPSTIL